ncbi:MAG: hypothetical protein Q9201_004573 [Fulgogasparrea decipioides]
MALKNSIAAIMTWITIAITVQPTPRLAILQFDLPESAQLPAVGNYIPTIIKNQSNNHSCATISGNVNGIHYQYSAPGRHCDTTLEQKTINAAVQKAIKYINNKNVTQACFEFTHGGIWKGHLQIAAQNRQMIYGK